jgi:DNA-binding transcriptional ArsR family regulator
MAVVKPKTSKSHGGSKLHVGTTSRRNSARAAKALKASNIFKRISDPTRLSLVFTLLEGELGVGALSTALRQSQPAIVHHLASLRHLGIVKPRRQGKNNFYSLTDVGLRIARVLRALVSQPPPVLKKPNFTTPGAPSGLGSPAPTSPRHTSIDPALLDDVEGFVDDPEAWFHTPNPAFEGRRPIDLLGTADEARLRNRIGAAKLGMFS